LKLRFCRLGGGLLAMGCALGLASCASRAMHRHAAFADDRGDVQIVSAVVGGKNVFIPSTVVVTAGKGQALSIYNATEAAHGFRIPGLAVEVVLPAGEETRVALPELSGRRVYQIQCHLHPPHRTATLVVLPGEMSAH